MNWALRARMIAFIGVFRGAVKAVWVPRHPRPQPPPIPERVSHGCCLFTGSCCSTDTFFHALLSQPAERSSTPTSIFYRSVTSQNPVLDCGTRLKSLLRPLGRSSHPESVCSSCCSDLACFLFFSTIIASAATSSARCFLTISH